MNARSLDGRQRPGYVFAMLSAHTFADAPTAPRLLVKSLLDAGLTADDIAVRMGTGITARSVYRWAAGTHAPQRPADLQALVKLADSQSLAVQTAAPGQAAAAE